MNSPIRLFTPISFTHSPDPMLLNSPLLMRREQYASVVHYSYTVQATNSPVQSNNPRPSTPKSTYGYER
eukprot:842386-Rhodomonas_salina.1